MIHFLFTFSVKQMLQTLIFLAFKQPLAVRRHFSLHLWSLREAEH